ncbi:hypothetical protein LGK95_03650 [Clostridium algoriphilum]|uniref:hypothetical protein n=1 Tax=Clostridium algoriphilum TaxID=198347 RepID=UPI001CF29BFE|nr:hypothetical protein [Clostridium algoriphilum]MCB2292631.1 hypothetical protein [Clostridium algoriphilum]
MKCRGVIMYSDYDNGCVKEIQSKIGINEKRALKYYEANGRDIEKTLKDIKNKIDLGIIEVIGSRTSGIIYGNVSNASTLYGMDKFNTPRGHGFAAERANHIYDKLTGKDAKIVGDDNAKFGADRVVNGVNIQSKYCNSGSKCIQECFQDGKFKYLNPDGSPMKIEVPSDKYDAAVQSMENRIKNGEVNGVTDPNEAKNIVRKGNFTYEQARNIAKFGTVESITFDAVNGAIIATAAFGISTVLTFATSIWNGDDFNTALKSATYSGLKVGGITFVTAVLASQLSKAGLNSALVGSSEAIISIMGPKVSAMLVNAFRSGTNIYGAAAMKSASKMLRGNAITGAVSVVVLSSMDVVSIFRGRISGAQLFKNVATSAATVAGGTAGWVGGATAGAAAGSFVPIIGTAIGGFIGGLLGSFAAGSVASKVSNTVLNEFIQDDANEMVNIIEKVFTRISEDYLLNQKEAEAIIDNLKGDLTGSTLKDMFASSSRNEFAEKLLMNHVESEVKKRKIIRMPSKEDMQKELLSVLEDISDNMAIA